MARIELSKTLGLALLFGVLASCPDAEHSWNDFLDATKDQRLKPGTCDTLSGELHDISGKSMLFLTVSGPLGGTVVPLFFQTEVTSFTRTGSGATFDITMQPVTLKKSARCNELWTPTANGTLQKSGVVVNAEGAFTIDFTNVVVVGCANPLSGSDIKADITMHGVTRSETRYCGTLTGKVFEPITGDLAPDTDKFGADVVTVFPTAQELAATYPGAPISARPNTSCGSCGGGGSGGSGGAGGSGGSAGSGG